MVKASKVRDYWKLFQKYVNLPSRRLKKEMLRLHVCLMVTIVSTICLAVKSILICTGKKRYENLFTLSQNL